MKKILLILFVVFSIFYLPACDSSSQSIDNLLTAFQEEKIIDTDLTLIDKVSKIETTLFYSQTTYYIYKNNNNDLIAINYNTDISSKNEYDYKVTIYYNVSTNDIEYLDNNTTLESYYSYQDGKKSEYNKYNLENKIDYLVYESKSLFSKTKYKIEKTN